MKALAWHGKGDMRCDSVPDPKIEHPRDAIIKVTACAICGSDLHIYDGVIPSMKHGDVLGHETMGEVVEVGAENKKLKVGDRVVVPFTIACGECFFCKRGFFSGCERSNPNNKMAEKLWGHSPAGLFGYSHLLGGFAGGQAEYLRVPVRRCRADQGAGRPDRRTGAVPVGHLPDRLHGRRFLQHPDKATRSPSGAAARSASSRSAAPSCSARSGSSRSTRCRSGSRWPRPPARMTLDFNEGGCLRPHPGADATGAARTPASMRSAPKPMRAPASIRCIDRVKVATFMGTDRPHVLRQAIHCCRNFGTVSIVGVYGGFVDKIPMGSAINRGLTFRMAQTPVQHYLPMLMERIQKGEIDPSFVITHRASLEEGPELYKTFRDKKDGCIKVVLKP